MSMERTHVTMDVYLKDLLARGAYAVHFADDVTFTVMGSGQTVRGKAEVEQFIRFLHEQAFDAEPVKKKLLVGDGEAVIEADFVGTQIAPFNGAPANGAQVNVPYAVYYDLKDDKITALRVYMPMDVLMQQINGTGRVLQQ